MTEHGLDADDSKGYSLATRDFFEESALRQPIPVDARLPPAMFGEGAAGRGRRRRVARRPDFRHTMRAADLGPTSS